MIRRSLRFVLAFLAFAAMFVVTAAPEVPGGGGGGGSRTVQTRNSKGQLSSTTSIPGGSAFLSHGSSGGKPQPCYYDKVVTETTPEGGEAKRLEKTPGDWVFRMVDPAIAVTIDVSEAWPALVDETIRFQVYCRGDDGVLRDQDYIDVSVRDPFFWDQATLDQLRADLQLAPIKLSVPASVGRWGGVIVRSKVPLQVNGDSWSPQSSPVVERRGVSLRVIVRPRVLAFRVVWEPNENATGDTPATSWKITCATGWAKTAAGKTGTGTTDAGWFPPNVLGASGDTYEPGLIDGECAWSPPDSGEVTVFADITYDVFDVVNNVSQSTPPYVWTGQITWTTGQLRAVNVTTP